MRILIITYYYSPYKGVGALRPTYWAKHINSQNQNIVCDLITAQTSADTNIEGPGRVIIVPDNRKSFISRLVKFDAGVNWYHSLVEFVKNLEQGYDVVIITGGPFMHFPIAKLFKKKFGSKIILDFRDPFANSPNMKMPFYKRWVKKFLERSYIKDADRIITVNSVCSGLLEKGEKTVDIIDNGFDETVAEKIEKKDVSSKVHKLIYPGKFYNGAPPDILLELLISDRFNGMFSFHYMGQDFERVKQIQAKNISFSGLVPYEEVLENISMAHTGIIFTGGHPFESTTKIFDYISLKKNILIISAGKIKTGIIHEITIDYPNVFWVENDSEQIAQVLKKIYLFNSSSNYSDYMKFSRKAGLEKLIKILDVIANEKMGISNCK